MLLSKAFIRSYSFQEKPSSFRGAVQIDEEWVTGALKYPNGLHAVAIYGFRDELIDRVWFAKS